MNRKTIESWIEKGKKENLQLAINIRLFAGELAEIPIEWTYICEPREISIKRLTHQSKDGSSWRDVVYFDWLDPSFSGFGLYWIKSIQLVNSKEIHNRYDELLNKKWSETPLSETEKKELRKIHKKYFSLRRVKR